jgi:excisionase family DNA binding protein
MVAEYLTKVELRAVLKISPATLDRLMKKDGLPYVKLGRRVVFSRDAVDRWMASKAVKK